MIAERAAISHTAAGAASVQFVPTPMAGYSSLMGFHRHLLEDRVRTGTFIRAIQQVVRQDDTVVDLGAGTGILTMACLRAGAQKVYAIEADQLIVLAEQAARANAMADRIVFMNRHSSDVTLPEKADVIVSECLGLMGIGGSMIPAVVDMRRRGLKAGGGIIPRGLSLFLVPVEFAAPLCLCPFLGPEALVWVRPLSLSGSREPQCPHCLVQGGEFHLRPAAGRRCRPPDG